MSDLVLLRCLRTGNLYPDYNATPGAVRYCADGDIIHATPEDARRLVGEGVAEEYDDYRMA